MYIRGEICPILFFIKETVVEYAFAVGSVFVYGDIALAANIALYFGAVDITLAALYIAVYHSALDIAPC